MLVATSGEDRDSVIVGVLIKGEWTAGKCSPGEGLWIEIARS